MDLNPPNIHSIFWQSKHMYRSSNVEFKIELDSICENNIRSAIKKKLNIYINKPTKYGYIVDIDDIISIDRGKYNILDYKSTITCNVIVSAWIFKPKYGDVLIGCKLISKDEPKAWVFEYTKSCKILVLSNTIKNKNIYDINDIVNIQIDTISYNFDIPKYKILVQTPTYKKEIYAIKIITSDDKIIKYLDVHGKIQQLPKKYEWRTINQIQMTAYGKIYTLYDIPSLLRYQKITKDITFYNINIVLTRDPSECDNNQYICETEFNIGDKDRMKINKYEVSWSTHMRYILNPYELIHPPHKYYPNRNKFLKTIGISKMPISRAYYKLFEIVKLHYPHNITKSTTFMSVGDAPGGFAEALNNLFPNNKIITISLKKDKIVSKKFNIPYDDLIDYNDKIKKNKKIDIDYMIDGDGNLLNIQNIISTIKKYKSSMKIVGCDAALNYEIARKTKITKEVYHTKLTLAEIILAIGCVSKSGLIAVKIYGRRTTVMGQILQWLTIIFKDVQVYKPKSVRIYNSEMFIIAKNKIIELSNSDVIQILNQVDLENQSSYIKNLFTFDNSTNIKRQLSSFNTYIDILRKFYYFSGIEMINRKLAYNEKYIKSIKLEQKKYARQYASELNI